MTTKTSPMKTTTTRKPTNLIIPALLIAVVVIVALVLVFNKPGDGTALPTTINVNDAYDRFNAGAMLLDVREVSEWEAGHVDGAVLMPLGELQSRISELPADQDILIICRSGNRSGQARDILRAAGMERTTSIDGGMNAWITAGLPVVIGK